LQEKSERLKVINENSQIAFAALYSFNNSNFEAFCKRDNCNVLILFNFLSKAKILLDHFIESDNCAMKQLFQMLDDAGKNYQPYLNKRMKNEVYNL
jgi:hypothetical protein